MMLFFPYLNNLGKPDNSNKVICEEKPNACNIMSHINIWGRSLQIERTGNAKALYDVFKEY